MGVISSGHARGSFYQTITFFMTHRVERSQAQRCAALYAGTRRCTMITELHVSIMGVESEVWRGNRNTSLYGFAVHDRI